MGPQTRPPLETLPGEGGHLGGVVEHDGDNGGVGGAEDLEAAGLQLAPEEVAVLAEGGDLSDLAKYLSFK